MEKKAYRAYFDNNLFPLNFNANNFNEALKIAFSHQDIYIKLRSIYLFPSGEKVFPSKDLEQSYKDDIKMVEILPIKSRKYYCPLCGNEESHTTNHIGEIYSHCKKCGHMVLYSEESKKIFKPIINGAIIHVYKFNIDNIGEYTRYKELCMDLEKLGYKKFDVMKIAYLLSEEMRQYEKIDKKQIDIYQDMGGQFVTNFGRLHNWFEAIFPNKKIKEGYYLEF